MFEDDAYMRQAIGLAWAAREKGNHPFGALLVVDDQVVQTAENTVAVDGDVTAHAELNLIREATRRLGADVVARATLVTSTEPCAMCAGAVHWAGIRRVVYGCPAETVGAMAQESFVIPCRHVFAFAREGIEVIGPVLEDEATAVHEGFWGESGE
jgi:tRNA(Arg) A34 adenosine deaminase TadA